jgi:hypothetical protein
MKVTMTHIGPGHELFGAEGIMFKGTSGWVTHQYFVPRDVLERLSGKQADSRLQLRQRFDAVADRIAEAAARRSPASAPGQPGSYIMLSGADFH